MRNLHLALVENDPSLNRAYARLLRAQGHVVAPYLSAEECLAAGVADTDCLVLDIDLGGMSGLVLHRQLQAANIHLPVIFITGGDDAGAEAQARAQGCHGFLRKPFSSADLQAAIVAISP